MWYNISRQGKASLNADNVFAQVKQTAALFAPFPIDRKSLVSYVERTEYSKREKDRFRSGEIAVDADCIRFTRAEAVNSYAIALLVNFFQDECINRGISFSQETGASSSLQNRPP